MYFEIKPAADNRGTNSSASVSAWMTVPMWLALVPVLVLGVWWPQDLWHFFEMVAADLGGVAR